MRLIDADAMIADLLTVDPHYEAMVHWCCTVVDAQPTAEPKTGHWVLDEEVIDCSACRHEKWSRTPYEDLVKRFRYCPNCGAKMEVEHAKV